MPRCCNENIEVISKVLNMLKVFNKAIMTMFLVYFIRVNLDGDGVDNGVLVGK